MPGIAPLPSGIFGKRAGATFVKAWPATGTPVVGELADGSMQERLRGVTASRDGKDDFKDWVEFIAPLVQ